MTGPSIRRAPSSADRSASSCRASWTPGRPTLLPRPARSYVHARVLRASSAGTSPQLWPSAPKPDSNTTTGRPAPVQFANRLRPSPMATSRPGTPTTAGEGVGRGGAFAPPPQPASTTSAIRHRRMPSPSHTHALTATRTITCTPAARTRMLAHVSAEDLHDEHEHVERDKPQRSEHVAMPETVAFGMALVEDPAQALASGIGNKNFQQ